ncbi:hypothetical protein A3A84_02200 [Candidatus Collierbacteria bacterium RIFCSPLOWO2_01_FULL_50_23]|uniref:ABC transporter domain-containing protein n=2 Tax=Candidatus Collieribacteriota TaxID=1752725 RepID=A0A1F5ER14_9BACT|nr:MAG: hypothetical protein A3D09_04520 [Candidatus Collierbacteria bacterium RIFCSPHIGHO2_02_FULL_49_10]OGD71199.1 MAG: hypothetical protein A2703_02435 [Candidatus Collierbacteria bacterium RIFCSPHIGHO2_01_FULL_50_25]OGD73770.1 MAG: hypothetical protein A3A84_02200 [Candidatus Collierbacteria bacterium RIFCSPLOWO2_01_FULL_50_23]
MHIQASKLHKTYSDRDILAEVSFTISDGEKVGLVGANGSGKSTLLKIITGIVSADSGSIVINPKNITVGYIPQAPDVSPNSLVRELLQLPGIQQYQIDRALGKIGIGDLVNRGIGSLSSGQRTKVFLARLLVTEPDILLLDEPTNHLDIEALEWLETYLNNYPGIVVLVSHDRRFLDNTVTRILELENGQIKSYGGNYTFYRSQKEIELETQGREFKKQQQTIKKLENEIEKKKEKIQKLEKSDRPTRDRDKYAATFFANRASRKMAKGAQSIESRLEQMELVKKPEPDLQLKALFEPKIRSGHSVLVAVNISKLFDKNKILDDIYFSIQRGQRIALLGSNGSGKTTLLKIITGELLPDTGKIEMGSNVKIGYLSQEQAELSSKNNVLEELTSQSGVDRTDAYRLLRKFLLPIEKINQPVETLSSGEKSKLLLAEIMVSGANLIILDEPTNHLDIPSREAIEDAIVNYEGTLLIVSHDRYFLDRIGITEYIELENGNIHLSKPISD